MRFPAMRSIVLLLSTLLTSGCVAKATVDYELVFGETGLDVTQAEPPADSHPLGTIVVKETGYYLFGKMPIVDVSLSRALAEVGRRALALEADGIASLEVLYEPATLFSFVIFPLPDWTATLKLTAEAYRRTPLEAGEANAPPEPEVESPSRPIIRAIK